MVSTNPHRSTSDPPTQVCLAASESVIRFSKRVRKRVGLKWTDRSVGVSLSTSGNGSGKGDGQGNENEVQIRWVHAHRGGQNRAGELWVVGRGL